MHYQIFYFVLLPFFLFIYGLKCLFWKNRDSNWLVAQYHRLLVWDLLEAPAFTRLLEKSMNPIMGKSVVMYFRKEAAA